MHIMLRFVMFNIRHAFRGSHANVHIFVVVKKLSSFVFPTFLLLIFGNDLTFYGFTKVWQSVIDVAQGYVCARKFLTNVSSSGHYSWMDRRFMIWKVHCTFYILPNKAWVDRLIMFFDAAQRFDRTSHIASLDWFIFASSLISSE